MKIEILNKRNINIIAENGVSFEIKSLDDGLLVRRANEHDEWHLPRKDAKDITVEIRNMLETYRDSITCFTVKVS